MAKRGFSEGSYLWRSEFDGLSMPDARLRDLEAESRPRMKMPAEQVFENDIFKDALRKSGDCTGAQAGCAEHDREGTGERRAVAIVRKSASAVL